VDGCNFFPIEIEMVSTFIYFIDYSVYLIFNSWLEHNLLSFHHYFLKIYVIWIFSDNAMHFFYIHFSSSEIIMNFMRLPICYLFTVKKEKITSVLKIWCLNLKSSDSRLLLPPPRLDSYNCLQANNSGPSGSGWSNNPDYSD